MTSPVITFQPEKSKTLVDEVMERSGQNLVACYQCKRCAAGCPVAESTEYFTPNKLIRTILFGDRDKALNNQLVWKCLSCYTCGTRCPNDIQTARITETLKKMSKEEHLRPLNTKVANFHSALVDSAVRWGRLNDAEFMGIYELKNTLQKVKDLKISEILELPMDQIKLGITMTRRRRMHFGIQTAKGRDELKKLYEKSKEQKKTK